MLMGPEEVRTLYRRTAPMYDTAVWMYRITGISRHRKISVAALRLQPGDTVVDMGCGTGLNLPLLRDAVGPAGRVIGVDLTDAMLERARRRVEQAGWGNVELIEANLTEYVFPPDLGGALATFALEMVPQYDMVVRRVAEALPKGRRLALYGLKHPDGWPQWLTRLGIWLNRPFGVTEEYAALRPWESVHRYMREVEHREFYGGAAYLSVGEAP